ncbi:hypothetical protein STXM2123_1011 [Streptomyces sp. F-3]|nr:hypothetical protein STXM2123_1011 [Streptomyces sp. F-3]
MHGRTGAGRTGAEDAGTGAQGPDTHRSRTCPVPDMRRGRAIVPMTRPHVLWS